MGERMIDFVFGLVLSILVGVWVIVMSSANVDSGQKDLYVFYGVYNNYYKVGVSNNVKRRRGEVDYDLNAKRDWDVVVVKIYPKMGHYESAVHDYFSEKNVVVGYVPKGNGKPRSGREWFDLTTMELGKIDSLIISWDY